MTKPRTPSGSGFRGAVSVETLSEVVQLYVLQSVTGMLEVIVPTDAARRGWIWFDAGTITQAITGDLIGEDAFYTIVSWTDGEFQMRPDLLAPERTIFCDWQKLVMESARRSDELTRTRRMMPAFRLPEERDGTEHTGWTEIPPPPLTLPNDPEPQVDVLFEEITVDESMLEVVIEGVAAMNIKEALAKLATLDGFIGASLVDSDSGMPLGLEGGGPNLNLELAAAGNTQVVQAKRKVMTSLALKDSIEDILISLGKQYHLIRPLRARPAIFFYVALDRQRANLAVARIELAAVEKDLQI